MSTTESANLTTPTIPHVPGSDDGHVREPGAQRFLMRGLDWATYRKISDALSGRHFRLAYDRGNLELMTISSTHGNAGRMIVGMVRVLTEEARLPLKSCGDMTCDREHLEKAVEPDECFYIRNAPRVRNKRPINLEIDPPPDLGVEIDITRSSLNRLAIHAAVGIPEVWRYNGEHVLIHQLGPDRQYSMVERSPCFPFLSGADLARFLNQADVEDENDLLLSFHKWVREQIAKKE